MALLKRSELIEGYKRRHGRFSSSDIAEGQIRKLAASTQAERFDVFLSHSYDDARAIREIRDLLTDLGLRVYVDWIDDAVLDRGRVTAETATILRSRMDQSHSIVYATSTSAEKSVWMPWELGYMDARCGRVCVAPIVDSDREFKGREYLGIYPYLDRVQSKLWVNWPDGKYVRLRKWLKGSDQ